MLALAGCGSGSGDGMTTGAAGTGTRPPIAGLQPTLASIQDNVFTPICTTCHGTSNPPQGLSLVAGASAGNLVNVPSPSNSSLIRVIPGNADGSFLIQKLKGTQTQGDRMPRGGPYLDPSTIDVISQWITNNATP